MPRDVETLYGCFRCGALQPPLRHDLSEDIVRCGECGERGVVTFRQALDILNEMHLKNRRQLEDVLDVIDISEYDFEEIANDTE